MKAIRKRLTYANVMSSIAVFLVLGGATAFAASHLGKNSVGTKQLKKNAVTAAKIKKNAVTTAKIQKGAVTGEKVNVTSFPTVPSANLANSLAPAEATHLVGSAGQPSFEGGSSNYAVEGVSINLNPVGFWKDHEGVVHLQGIALAGKPGTGIASVFTLPQGFRPASGKVLLFEQIKEAPALIAGDNTVLEGHDLSDKISGTEGKPVSLEGITFRAEG